MSWERSVLFGRAEIGWKNKRSLLNTIGSQGTRPWEPVKPVRASWKREADGLDPDSDLGRWIQARPVLPKSSTPGAGSRCCFSGNGGR